MSFLSQELEKQIIARLREKGLVFWLDREGLYSRFVDDLQQSHEEGRFFAPVVAFRGSFLETMLALEPYESGLDPTPLLVHLPGHTDVTVRRTPLLEAYKCGTRFERALETLVREVAAGRVSPEQTERYIGQGKGSLEEAEEWLAGLMDRNPVGLVAILQSMEPQWVLDGLVEAPNSEFSRRITGAEDLEALRQYLARHTGFSPEFLAFFLEGESSLTLRSLTEGWVGWLLCVEYVHDLGRPPSLPELQPLRGLSAPLRKACIDLVGHLRKRHVDAYRVYAMQTEGRLEAELNAGTAEELGKIDTFSREDTRLLEAALASLEEEHWAQALGWAASRLESPSVWLEKDLSRRQEWSLVRDAATLGLRAAGNRQPLQSVRNLEEALLSYTGVEGAHLVDRAHRHFEQERLQHLSPQIPHYPGLERAATLVRRRYREWLDDLTGAFSDLCAQEGFLPPAALQQRHLYEQVVHPLTQSAEARVAYFMVDALRFEMASELAERLEGQVHLKARFSELPSITSVGMNVLAPVCRDGSLTPDDRSFSGFRAGQYSVKNPQQRVRAMGDRSLERHAGSRRTPLLLSLAEVGNLTAEKLAKQVKGATLVVVHSREIDSSGEADVGPATFDRLIGQLRSAVHHLRNAGVEEFVLTADHGFLLLDDSREPFVYHSEAIDRRFILTDTPGIRS
ncbi:BREX-6 system phosphatase PglZ [bacterium CPR1]|nr:BREX-6 system phosphatase PglZ [bacterium CPR1]